MDYFRSGGSACKLAGKAAAYSEKLGSALIVILVLGGIVGILYLGISRLILEVASLVRDFPSIYAQLESGLSQIGDTLSGVFDRLPEVVQNGWNTVASNLDQYMGKVVSGISEPTVSAAGNIAKRVPYYLVSFVVAIMSAYFSLFRGRCACMAEKKLRLYRFKRG